MHVFTTLFYILNYTIHTLLYTLIHYPLIPAIHYTLVLSRPILYITLIPYTHTFTSTSYIYSVGGIEVDLMDADDISRATGSEHANQDAAKLKHIYQLTGTVCVVD